MDAVLHETEGAMVLTSLLLFPTMAGALSVTVILTFLNGNERSLNSSSTFVHMLPMAFPLEGQLLVPDLVVIKIVNRDSRASNHTE